MKGFTCLIVMIVAMFAAGTFGGAALQQIYQALKLDGNTGYLYGFLIVTCLAVVPFMAVAAWHYKK